MQTSTLPYPPMPEGADNSIIKPSKAFKREVYRSLSAVILFVLTYIFLLVTTIAIATFFCFLGYTILSAHVGLWGILAGVGIAVAGLMLVFFVIKFLFKWDKINYSDKAEIYEAEQPELFKFIYKVTEETGANKPKRIFLTADVNAGVFYDSSFWSMIFPVKKNLQIGLGLINCVNLSEFKAITAHEFGHFSQRSMKFGSYVYNFNRIMYNMLYDNESYAKILNGWARIHGIFTLMAQINIWIIKGIQFILKRVYLIVNKSYLKLSREMEFHADAMAAYASGSNNATSALKRIEIGQLCYTNVLDYWNLKLSENQRTDNIYPQHIEVIKLYAEKYKLFTDDSGLPIVGKKIVSSAQSQLVVDDQWSSHPSNDDREHYLSVINLNATTLTESAWALFKNKEQLQLMLTEKLYASVSLEKPEMVGLAAFKEDFNKTINHHRFNKVYKNYFDFRNINIDTEKLIPAAYEIPSLNFEDLLNEENAELPRIAERMQGDINSIEKIVEIRKDIKTFDYKGVKYGRQNAATVMDEVEKERKDIIARIQQLDEDVFRYFYALCPDKKTLLDKYLNLQIYQENVNKDYDLYTNIISSMKHVYAQTNPDHIVNLLRKVNKQEPDIKARMQEIIADESFREHLSEEHLKDISVYSKNKWVYFYDPTYDDNAIAAFNKAMDAFYTVVYNKNFVLKNDLLEYQASLINTGA